MMTHQADQHPHVSQNLKCPSIEIKSTEAMSPSDVCLVTNQQPTTTHTTQSPATGRTCCNTALCKHCCKPTQFFLHNVISGMPEHLSTRSHNHISRREYKNEVKRYNKHNPAPKSYRCIRTSNVHLQKGIAAKKQTTIQTHKKKASDMQFQSSRQKNNEHCTKST